MYLYNILKIDLLSEDLTIIELDNKIITIKGKNITTYKYCNNEIILSGLIESININESKNNN